MTTDPIIVTDSLSRRFGDTVAVDGLTLEVYAGEIFGFLGHNGAGKTTTVRLLNGILTPSGGTARVLGLDPVRDGPALRRRTGVLTETPSLDERLTGRENLAIYADLYDVPVDKVPRRVEELLETFGLVDRADEPVGNYSRGMKQRLALARALLHEPEVLFLDEPTAGLDPVATRRVHQLIAHLSHEGRRTVFLCTHNLTEAQELCDRVAVLEHGQLVAVGTPAELARRLWRGLRLEVELAPEGAHAAVEAMRAISGVDEVEWDASTAVVRVSDREAVPTLVAAAVAAGGRIYRVVPREPTLEDVYFALHGESTAKEGLR
ncbi:MAG TPA: ABC transporter ATP-binding protein [Thermoflexia bacterium]|jgi:ABC-2 type transport system ATP-binding protein|nr:ABC transporter ATP-binding protein [Thermoflexia bacterium]